MKSAKLRSLLACITLAATAINTRDSLYALDATWNVNASGNWIDVTRWNPNTTFPNGVGETASVVFDITATRTVTIPAATNITIGNLNVGDVVGNSRFIIAGPGTLTFDASAGNATLTRNVNGGVGNDTISAAIILNDNLDITNSDPLSNLTLSGNITETGGIRNITKNGGALTVLAGTNSYTGTTTVNGGLLLMASEASLYNGSVASWNSTNIIVNAGAALGLDVGGTGDFSDANVALINTIGSATGGFLPGSSLALNPTVASYTYANPVVDSNSGANSVGLAKLGLNKLIISSDANTYTGPTTVLQGNLQFAQRNGLYGGNTANWTESSIVVATGATLSLNVGGTGEFTSTDIQALNALGSGGPGGFQFNALLGLDTTNAALGEFVYSDSIVNTAGGFGAFGIEKLGANTLTLSGSNSYTGPTIVRGGKLKITGSHAPSSPAAGNYSVGFAAGEEATLEMVNANVNVALSFDIGKSGIGHATMNGGTLNTPYLSTAELVGSTGDFTLSNGAQLTVGDQLYVGLRGAGNMTLNDATTTVNCVSLLVGWNAGITGTYVQNDGDVNATLEAWFGRAGTGNGTINGGTFDTQFLAVGHLGGAVGDLKVTGGSAVKASVDMYVGTFAGATGTLTTSGTSTTEATSNIFLGYQGTGTINVNNSSLLKTSYFAVGWQLASQGTLNVNDNATVTVNNDLYLGTYNTSTGTLNLNSGTVNVNAPAIDGGQGLTLGFTAGATGTLNINGGTLNVPASDLRVGQEGTGTVNHVAGTVNANRVIAGDAGIGTYHAKGNAIVNVVPGTPDSLTYNSATTSIAANTNGPGFELGTAVQGNLIVGRSSGATANTGSFNLSETAVVNVGANVFVGAAEIDNLTTPGTPIYTGGKGVLAISGGTMNVGTGSATGGDVILGSPATATVASVGTINLSGGVLNAANGTGVIASAGGTTTFNFTGGTLKMKGWNKNLGAGATLGDLTQNGAGSLLDVTGNDTVLHSGYALGAGNATVGAGRTLTIEGGMTDLAGTGVISVNAGGAIVSNNVRTDTLNLTSGTATINANGGTAGASKVETLNMVGTSKFNLKDNDLVVGTAANVDAVRNAIVAGKANNAVSGITSDVAAFGTTTGFGYALGNDPNISALLAGSLTGQTYDANSVLVKYTFLGDADLDGDSDLNDLGFWAQSFTGDLGNPATPVTFWTSGDFDYDGDTDLNDLGFWAGTFTGDLGGGAGSLVVVAPNAPAGAVAALNSMGITVVPEPSTFVLAGIGLAGLAIASRRKKRT